MQPIASKSVEGLEQIFTVSVYVFEAAILAVSKKMETTPMQTRNQTSITSVVTEAAGQRFKQTVQKLSTKPPDIYEASNHGSVSRTVLRSDKAGAERNGDRFIHAEGAHAQVRGVRDAAVTVCGAGSRVLGCNGTARKLFIRVVGFHRRQRTNPPMPYAGGLKKPQCESVETTISKRLFLWRRW